jgi:hypothetical protein
MDRATRPAFLTESYDEDVEERPSVRLGAAAAPEFLAVRSLALPHGCTVAFGCYSRPLAPALLQHGLLGAAAQLQPRERPAGLRHTHQGLPFRPGIPTLGSVQRVGQGPNTRTFHHRVCGACRATTPMARDALAARPQTSSHEGAALPLYVSPLGQASGLRGPLAHRPGVFAALPCGDPPPRLRRQS